MASRLRFVPWPDKTETLRKDHKQSIYIHFAFIAPVKGSYVLQTDSSIGQI